MKQVFCYVAITLGTNKIAREDLTVSFFKLAGFPLLFGPIGLYSAVQLHFHIEPFNYTFV